MESGALEIETTTIPDPRKQPNCSIASLRRRAWAQSKDSIWHESDQEHSGPQSPEENQRDGDAQRPSEEAGQVPNKITSWLIECGTPIGASLDDQSASPNRGVLRNGCSFEDDLSLGAEANHLQSSNKKADSCFGFAAEQKRSQYKERGRSMNSTGSGKSSTVSRVSEVMEHTEEHPEEVLLTLCVSELLDLYEEDPEEILLNLGFGREEPDLASKVPSRFLNGFSSARGIDIKVYLGAQMQRMELENPNYALTSRFRQIEVLTTVANEFFQLYSQVSGQPVERISSRDQDGGEEKPDEPSPVLKRGSSARNVAKFLKKTITKHNLLAAASPEAQAPSKQTRLNGHTPSDHMLTNGHTNVGPEQDSPATNPDHQVETASQKHNRKKDSCSLATVTEETNGDGETDCLMDNSPQQSHARPATNGECQPESADLQSTNQRTEVGPRVVKVEKSLTSTPVKAPQTLTPPQLAQLRNENAESFDMEEIQSNDDEGLPSRNSRATDLLRTVSQQSDSSGFAEEPSADSNSYLKVQESCDSCDSETTVTSHPSQDVATPLAVDQPAFDLPDCIGEEPGPGGAGAANGRSSSREEDGENESSEQIPQYTAHYFPKNKPIEIQQDKTQEEENPAVDGDIIDPQEETESEPEKQQVIQTETLVIETETQQVIETETQPKLELQIEPLPDTETEVPHSMSAAENEPQLTQNHTETTTDTEPPIVGEDVKDMSQDEPALSNSIDECSLPVPSSPVLGALNRAKQSYLSRTRMHIDSTETPQGPRRGRGRRGIPMQRSSSLPSSILSPSRVVSSVRIQFGQGQTSCTLPRYSFRYTQTDGKDKEVEEVEKETDDGQTNCLSTLVINPALSTSSNNQAPRLNTDASIPPKPIPRYLLRSSCSLNSSSPPPDWSPSGPSHCWSTQSIPDLSSHQQPPGHFQNNICTNQNQQSWNQGQMMFPYSNPTPTTQYVNPSPHPSPSPSHNPSPYPFTVNPPLYYPLQPYASLPNLHHPYSHSMSHHSSLSSLHQPATPTAPLHSSLSNLHQPGSSIAPQHINLGSLHPDTPIIHHQGYNHTFSHQSPYHTSPHGSQFASPYFAYPGYNTTPHPAFPHSATPYPLVPPQHGFHQSLAPPAPGFLPGLASPLDQGNSLHPGFPPPVAPGLGHSHGPSNTEMQLRKVLHDIRGTVQSLSQNRANTPDTLSEHPSAVSSQQSLAEFQHKRWSLNLFRSQMMDLEMSIIRQQAQVYKHLSPADRLEVEQLHSLRSAVREQLQELEQQLEDRLTQHRGLHRDSSVDSLSTASALRAMEPMSDLLREQDFLQSELSYDGHTPSTTISSRLSSPVLGGGRDGEQGQGVYRASINITPVPPPRAITHTQQEEVEKMEGGREEEGKAPKDRPTGGVGSENLQQLIREIRESVAEEVRREILSELLAAVSTRESPLPVSQHPL
ncbi:protein ITPRID2 isoform X2 [Solea solea]|uniref:protein ITPRID2 isoform X2 n=1 Tax=Solea solea TaxID=90069 RepID=UPI00272BB6D3|nr:protein ITPRID2 isoform X2 [Solea solea]